MIMPERECRNMNVEQIQEKLRKTATIFETGGFRPTNRVLESWIAKVSWKKEMEEIPNDIDGNKMLPLATLFLDGCDGVPEALSDVYLCTVFISPNIIGHRSDTKGYFEIRTYKKMEELVPCNWEYEGLKAFPLKPQNISSIITKCEHGIYNMIFISMSWM